MTEWEGDSDKPVSLAGMLDMFDRILPCPPASPHEPGSDADYLWRATLFNASHQPRPLRLVQFSEYRPLLPPNLTGPISDEPAKIITVECDERGKGVRVLR